LPGSDLGAPVDSNRRLSKASVGTNLLYEEPELGFQILAHMGRDYAGGRMITEIPGH